jgi:hypothetical protein
LNQSKTPKVLLLGENVLCQYAEHKCQGVYHCDQLDMTLLSDCKRYEPDENAKRELFEAEREVNKQQSSSSALRAIS